MDRQRRVPWCIPHELCRKLLHIGQLKRACYCLSETRLSAFPSQTPLCNRTVTRRALRLLRLSCVGARGYRACLTETCRVGGRHDPRRPGQTPPTRRRALSGLSPPHPRCGCLRHSRYGPWRLWHRDVGEQAPPGAQAIVCSHAKARWAPGAGSDEPRQTCEGTDGDQPQRVHARAQTSTM